MVRRVTLQTLVAVAIFLVQAALAVFFFWNLGTGDADRVILAATGVSLELAKRYCWSLGPGHRQRWAIVGLALVFSGISGLAAVAYSWSVVESGLDRAEVQDARVALVQAQLEALGEERDDLRKKLSALPPDWVSNSLRYSARLAEISRDQQGLRDQLGETGEPGKGEVRTGIYHFKVLAESSGISWKHFVLGFLVLISALLEVGVVITTSSRRPEKVSSPGGLELLIIRTAYQSPGKPLVSRRKIASQLKVSEAEVRKVLRRLTALGAAATRPGSKGLFPLVTLDECVSRWLQGYPKVLHFKMTKMSS